MEPEKLRTRLMSSYSSDCSCPSLSSHSTSDTESEFSVDSRIDEKIERRALLSDEFFALLKEMMINLGEEHEWIIRDELMMGDRKMTRLSRMFMKHKKWPIMCAIVRYCECLRFVDIET